VVSGAFTADIERAREVAGQMRTGAIGREGGVDGLLPFLESKASCSTARPPGTTT
jgi:hypothetical protein